MSDESMSKEPIIKRTCAGRCGAVLHCCLLAPASESGTLVLTCLDSVTAVEEALACRRERQREASEKDRAARRARVRAQGGRR